jgi:prepilin-type processing-associated H-X9-DG protein
MNGNHPAPGYMDFNKVANLSQPYALFAFIDENPVTINDGMFLVFGQPLGIVMMMNDWPATYHGGASGISFADGHAEMHLWRYLGAAPTGYNPGSGIPFNGNKATDAKYLVSIATLPNSGSW